MPRQYHALSGYRGMWIFAMFDLPVKTRRARKRYTRFRQSLLQDGFWMVQYSIYARYCASEDVARTHRKRIQAELPPEGCIRLLTVTDRQFGKMESYIGKKAAPTETAPEQLLLF